jgi:hypothetical protein
VKNRKSNSTADALTSAIGAFGEKMRKEAEAFAALAIDSFTRNYKRRAAKRKPAARRAIKRATTATRKAVGATTRKAKTMAKSVRKPVRATKKAASRTVKSATKSRRRKSA